MHLLGIEPKMSMWQRIVYTTELMMIYVKSTNLSIVKLDDIPGDGLKS